VGNVNEQKPVVTRFFTIAHVSAGVPSPGFCFIANEEAVPLRLRHARDQTVRVVGGRMNHPNRTDDHSTAAHSVGKRSGTAFLDQESLFRRRRAVFRAPPAACIGGRLRRQHACA